MRLNMCFVLLSLGLLTLTQAGPAPKSIEKKSLVESTKIEKDADPKLEETGAEKDRSKKSATTFCVQIRPGSPHATQTSCKDQQFAEPIPQSAQLNVQPQQQPPQQVQTLNVVQPAQQPPQASIVLPAPQPTIQPVQTLHIMHQAPQAYPQSVPSFNIIPAPQPAVQTIMVQPAPQPAPQLTPQPAAQPAPQPAPKPAPQSAPQPAHPSAPKPIPMPVPEQPEPTQVFVQPLPQPQESFSVLPVASACNDQMYAISSSPMMYMPESEQQQLAALVQVPTMSQTCTNPQHGLLSQCTCQSNNMALRERSMGSIFGGYGNVMPMMAYPSASFARSPMVVQLARNSDGELDMAAPSPKERTRTIIHMHGSAVHPHSSHVDYGSYPATTYASGGYSGYSAGAGLTINAYPHIAGGHLYRSASPDQQTYRWTGGSLESQDSNANSPIASEIKDLMESEQKSRREVDQKQLVSDLKEGLEKDNIETGASLIDGRRAVRSNKAATKVEETSSTKN